MIVVDSSVWIDFFNGVSTPEVDRLDALLLEGLKSIEEEGTVVDTDEYWSALQERIKAGEFRKRKMQTA